MAKNYSLMRCRECGFPRLVSFFIKWNDNGTITQLMRKNFRVVVLHGGFLDNLFSSIEARLGLSIEHIAYEAQRNASKAVFQAFYDRIGLLKVFVRFGFVKRMGVEQFNKVGAITGQCLSQTIEYQPGKRGVARVKNPFNLNLMAANVVGAFETLEGVPFRHSWEEEGRDTYLITVEPTGEKPGIAERMELEYAELLPGSIHYDRCTRCKTPRGVSHLKWMENEGIILDTHTGTRVIMLDGYMVTTVFREMARELGEEVYELMVDAQREWTVEHIEQLGLAGTNDAASPADLADAYRKYLEILPLFGQGNPVSFDISDSTLRIKVENPYEPHILAGTLQGLYEALEKVRGNVTWEETARLTVSYTIQPE